MTEAKKNIDDAKHVLQKIGALEMDVEYLDDNVRSLKKIIQELCGGKKQVPKEYQKVMDDADVFINRIQGHRWPNLVKAIIACGIVNSP